MRSKIIHKIDARLIWGLRYLFYKILYPGLRGVGYFGPPCFLKGMKKFHAGSGLGIFPGSRIEILDGRVQIGKNVRIGHNFFLNCGSSVVIEDDVTISANVFIGTTDFKPDGNYEHSFKHWPAVERPVRVGKGSFIGFGAAILPGTDLAEGCIVGANAVVRGKFEPGSIIASGKSACLKKRS